MDGSVNNEKIKKSSYPLPNCVPDMLRCPAEGCKYVTKSDRALASHMMRCTYAAAGLSTIADNVREHEGDQRQAKRPRISPPEHLETAVPDPDEDMDVDLEARLWIVT